MDLFNPDIPNKVDVLSASRKKIQIAYQDATAGQTPRGDNWSLFYSTLKTLLSRPYDDIDQLIISVFRDTLDINDRYQVIAIYFHFKNALLAGESICRATRKSGKPCTYRAKEGSPYCGIHNKYVIEQQTDGASRLTIYGIFVDGKLRNDALAGDKVYVEGPTVMAYYADILGKKILLLGEVHVTYDFACADMQLHEYIDALQAPADGSCIDLFHEGSFGPTEARKPYQQWMTPYLRGFKQSSITKSGVYLRAREDRRIHNADPRHGVDKTILSSLDDSVLDDIPVDYESIVRGLVTGFDDPEDTAKFIAFIKAVSAHPKHGRNTNADTVPSHIRWIETYRKILNKRYAKLQIDRAVFIDYFMKIFMLNKPSMLDLSMIIMDVYLLSRIFTKFSGDRGSDRDRGSGCPHEPRNVLVHAGAAHIHIYIQFFYLLSGRTPDLYSNVGAEQCMYLPRQPFISEVS